MKSQIPTLILIFVCVFAACKNNPAEEYFEAPDIEMLVIPPESAGLTPPYTFMMGSDGEASSELDKGESPKHEVTLTKAFRMGKYQITQAQYRAVTGKNPSRFQGKIMLNGVNILNGVNTDNLPVEQVSWYQAVEYCIKLSQLEGLTPAYEIDYQSYDHNNASNNSLDPHWVVSPKTGNGYRLPTEAQWEFACRAGLDTPFSVGDGMNITVADANFNGVSYIAGNPQEQSLGRTIEVGSYAPNAWGLYDMHGNVYELCWDRVWQPSPAPPDVFKNYYDETGPGKQTDPMGLDRGDRRAERGGMWRAQGSRLRSAYRERIQPNDIKFGNGDLGFRVILPLEGEWW